MKIKSVIRNVLREEYPPTETSYLGWDVPTELYDELKSIGVKIYDIFNNRDSDKVYVAEINFDTESVVFEVISEDKSYYYVHKIKNLPRKVKIYLVRRFESSWNDYMGK